MRQCIRADAHMRPQGPGASSRTRARPPRHGASVQTRPSVCVDMGVCVDAPPSAPLPSSPLPSPPLPSPLPPSILLFPCPRGRKKTKKKQFFLIFNFFNFLIFFGSCCWLGKREKIFNFQFSVFGFQSPKSPKSPNSTGEAARRRRFFRPSSPSHPFKLYSSLGWLNSKVPKPFPPFSLRLIDVDGF
jgi:hypothetical protein